MAGPIFTGEAETQLQSSWVWDPKGGTQLVETYWGRYTELGTRADAAIASGRKVSMEPQTDGSWVLRVFYGGETDQSASEALSDYWERDSNDPEKSVWLIPKVATAMAQITDVRVRSMVRKAAEDLTQGEYDFVDDAGDTYPLTQTYVMGLAAYGGMTDDLVSNPTNPVGTGVLKLLLDDMAKGVESWPMSSYVLRRTVIVASNAGEALKPVDTNNNRMLTTAQLSTHESLPAALKFNVPTGYWLRRTPRIAQISNNRWQITYEFWHADEYSSLLYTRAT